MALVQQVVGLVAELVQNVWKEKTRRKIFLLFLCHFGPWKQRRKKITKACLFPIISKQVTEMAAYFTRNMTTSNRHVTRLGSG